MKRLKITIKLYISETNFRLAKFVDTYGARISGSQVLEDSIDYMIQLTREEEINDVVTEELEVIKDNRKHFSCICVLCVFLYCYEIASSYIDKKNK